MRKIKWDGWYVCEWECGRKFRRGSDYAGHVASKHSDANGMPAPWPVKESSNVR